MGGEETMRDRGDSVQFQLRARNDARESLYFRDVSTDAKYNICLGEPRSIVSSVVCAPPTT